jgi:DNA-binding transcriptional LysR family regulator
MDLRAFDLNLLKVLDAVIRERSTVRAGQAIGLSQPAVSAALGRLRAALGDPILVREGRTMRPTALALEIAGPLSEVLEGARRLIAPADFDPGTASASFGIVGSDFFTEMMLPPLAARLRAEAPGVRLRYSDAVGVWTLAELREGTIDINLMPDIDLPPWLLRERVLRVRYVVVAARTHPALAAAGIGTGDTMPPDLFARLSHASFRVIPDRPEDHETALAAAGVHPAVAFTGTSFAAVLRMVAESDLIGIVPRRMADRAAEAASLAVLDAPVPIPPTSLYMVWHRRTGASGAHAWLRRIVADVLRPLDEGP